MIRISSRGWNDPVLGLREAFKFQGPGLEEIRNIDKWSLCWIVEQEIQIE